MTCITDRRQRLDELQAQLDSMPPVRAMHVRATRWDGESLHLAAPLAANVNDKGNAFGGSLSGLMTLACWAWFNARLADGGRAAEIYVADSRVRYLAPLYGDLHAVGRLAEGVAWEAVLTTFDARGRARAALTASIHDAEGRCVAELDGRFVAFRRSG